MIEELNGENDEAKLLRVRTKKNELVVVPGMLYIIHLAVTVNREQMRSFCSLLYMTRRLREIRPVWHRCKS